MKMRLIICSSFILGFFCRVHAQNLRDPRFMARANEGFDDVFNMDYDKADRAFVSLEKEYPQHPQPPLYRASILWLKEMLRRQDLDLNRFISPAYFSKRTSQVMPAQERTDFYSKLQRSESLSNAILQKNSRDKDARYFLSTAYGLHSSFAMTIDHSLREAFSYGNKSYSLARQLTEEDASYYDAYLTAGIYNYVVGTLPWYMRWMIFIISSHGSRQDGIAYVKIASEKGQYMKDQAKLVSMVLYVREQRYAEGLELARELSRRFPRSYLFSINLAQILRFSGRKEEAVPLFLQIEKRVEAGEPNFDKLPLQSIRFSIGTELLFMGKLDLALERFQRCIDDPRNSVREKALSHLRLARILNWKGQRAAAIQECQRALSFPDFENSHDEAKKLLDELSRKKELSLPGR
jgi:tetratricopeptide (TPR) repeat protein